MAKLTRKVRKAKAKTKAKSVRNRTPTPYVHKSYMNVTQTYKNGHGRRNTVIIRNGRGVKRVELLGDQGEVLKTQTRSLTSPEKEQILRGKFIPGLWRNCNLC